MVAEPRIYLTEIRANVLHGPFKRARGMVIGQVEIDWRSSDDALNWLFAS